MADANGVDLSQMHAWYTQAGTPTLSVVSEWHAATQTLQLKVTQSLPEVVNFQPLLIPLSMAIFNESGCRQSVVLQQGKGDWQGSEGMIWLTQVEETLVFTQVAELPRLSLLRNFSAPVILQMERRLDDWLWQAAHDDDLFNRWEAWQQVWVSLILSGQQALSQGRDMSLPSTLLPIIKAMLLNDELPAAWLAEALRLPSFDYLAQQVSPLSPQSIWDATQQLKCWLANELRSVIWQVLEERLATIQQFAFSADVIANRSWCHLLLSYLASVADERAFAWAYDQVVLANNMTNSQAALTLLVHHQAPQAQDALVQFYQRWQGVGLVLDKWFSVQAGNPQASIEQVESLCQHERFVRTTPNRVRSVLGVFGRANPRVFHQADGAGYRLLVEQVAEIDAINPQIAARLIQAFNAWQKLVPTQQALAGAALASLSARAHLSKDLREVLGNLGHATV
jgi:aminopeptidase N